MKKIIYALAASLIAFSFASCQKEAVITTGNAGTTGYKNLTISATTENPVKLALEDGKTIKWTEGDSIRVYYKRSSNDSTASSYAHFVNYAGDKAQFSLSVLEDAVMTDLYAVFLSDGNSDANGSPFEMRSDPITKCKFMIPHNQQVVKDGLDKAGAPMVAHWTGEASAQPSFDFKNVCGLLSFNIINNSSEEIDSVKFFSSTKFMKKGYFGFDGDGLPKISGSTYSTEPHVITLSGNITSGTYTFACAIAAAYANPIIVFYAKSGKYCELNNPSPIPVLRNVNCNIGTFTLTNELFAPYIGLSKSGILNALGTDTNISFYVTGNCSWNLSVSGAGASLSKTSGEGMENVTLTLPLNMSDNSKDFVVTLTTDNPGASEKTKTFTVRQSAVVGIPFGTAMSSTFTSSLKDSISAQGSGNGKSYMVEGFSVKQISNDALEVDTSTNLIKKKFEVSFVSKSAGNGILTFLGGRAYKGKACTLTVTGTGVINTTDAAFLKASSSANSDFKNKTIRISGVSIGDVITFSTGTSTGNNNLGLLKWDEYTEE